MYNLTIDNKQVQYPSVSQICGLLDKSNSLIPWACNAMGDYIIENYENISDGAHDFENLVDDSKKAHKRINERSKKIGTEVHNIIDKINKNQSNYNIKSKEVENCVKAFLDWESVNDFKILESEKTLFNHKYCFAGTLDQIAALNTHDYILDIKTSNGIYSEHKLQVAGGYAILLDYETRAGILRLDKETGEYEFKDITKNMSKTKKAFLALLDFYYHGAKRKLKNNPRIEQIWG